MPALRLMERVPAGRFRNVPKLYANPAYRRPVLRCPGGCEIVKARTSARLKFQPKHVIYPSIMSRENFRAVSVFVLLALAGSALANSVAPSTPEQQVDRAAAICRATVQGWKCYRNPADGGIYTRTVLRLDEALKGKFSASFAVHHRGGIVGGEAEIISSRPRFLVGEERLLFLAQRADGTLYAQDGPASARLLHRATNGFVAEEEALLSLIRNRVPDPAASGADVTSQAATWGQGIVGGLLSDNGVSSRFTAPDRGEPIEYLVDADALPAGISAPQAMNALSNAFKAWSDVTSLKFVFAGYQSFGTNAADVNINDQRIRVQLHDSYGYIDNSSTLGIGGRVMSISPAFPNGGQGGNVLGIEFHPTLRGSLVLNHTHEQMRVLSTYEEVMTHEIGHVLSLDHSSVNSPEPSITLSNAMMYFQVHADGRGATLGVYDTPMIQQVFPKINTPPYSYDRVMDIITQPSGGSPNVPGINQIELWGHDLQTANLTVVLTNATSGFGTFSLNGTILKFTPRVPDLGTIDSGSRLDPASGFAYDRTFLRFSDGTNGSPFAEVRVISMLPDQNPGGVSDGLPDDWVAQYFGSASASVDPNGQADGDGISNLKEFISGTNPTNAADALKITSITSSNLQWLARPYDLYEVQGTTDFTNWFRVGNPILPTNSPATLTNFFNLATNRLFLRVIRVP